METLNMKTKTKKRFGLASFCLAAGSLVVSGCSHDACEGEVYHYSSGMHCSTLSYDAYRGVGSGVVSSVSFRIEVDDAVAADASGVVVYCPDAVEGFQRQVFALQVVDVVKKRKYVVFDRLRLSSDAKSGVSELKDFLVVFQFVNKSGGVVAQHSQVVSPLRLAKQLWPSPNSTGVLNDDYFGVIVASRLGGSGNHLDKSGSLR